MAEIGKNVIAKKIGNKLVIEIDLAQDFGRTKNGEGKNTSIATTGGNVDLGESTFLGLNVYKKPSTAVL